MRLALRRAMPEMPEMPEMPGTPERPRRPRDGQRARVYRAERAVPEGRRLPTLAAVQRYVDRVTTSALWRRLAPNRPRVEVRDGRGRRRAGSYVGLPAIAVPRVHRRERHVLHELAHQLADAAGGPEEPAHGWRFAAGLLLLLEAFLAPEAAAALRAAYGEAGVRYRPPVPPATVPRRAQAARKDVAAADAPGPSPGRDQAADQAPASRTPWYRRVRSWLTAAQRA
jgi:putative metallohydrolase (TIGR04338 family)